jgi:hypothetical protein
MRLLASFGRVKRSEKKSLVEEKKEQAAKRVSFWKEKELAPLWRKNFT